MFRELVKPSSNPRRYRIKRLLEQALMNIVETPYYEINARREYR
jgi:hypothetical protein